MNGYLLDTNVISSLAPSRPDYNRAFAAWLLEQEAVSAVFLSAVTIEEMARGIGLLEVRGASAKAASLGIFLERIVAGYGDRILPLDVHVARQAGRLEARAMSAGQTPGVADAIIAGTAMHRGLTVITRNLRHFMGFDIPLISPDRWEKPS